MDSMFVWIVMFAGAAITLLAVFLVASEKELKRKRLEIDQLLTKLGDNPAGVGTSALGEMAPAFDSHELDQLRSRNQELESELAELSSKLQSGANTDEELDLAQRNVELAKSNAQWLQSNNDELKAQIVDLKSRLQASQAHANNSASVSQGSADRQLEREIADLREQLAESKSQPRELAGFEQKLANLDAVESQHREEKSRLEARIAELERELSAASAATTNEAESLREQLAESERLQQLMRGERRGLEQEMARWQARVKQAEEQCDQFSALQAPLDDLLAQQSALVERQRDYHEAMAGFSRLIAKSNERLPQAAGFNEFHAAAPMGNDAHDADLAAVSPAQVIAAAQTAQKPKRRFGLFPVVIALLFGGSLTALFWSMQGSDTTTTASALPVVTPNKAATQPVRATLPEPAVSEPPAQPETPAVKEVAKPMVKEKAQPAKAVEVAKVQQPVGGTYEITQSSRVYAAPNELAQQLGDIEPGVRVNVVDAKNGWLEIHSKHGRPPGYIRKESARVLARN
jgi:hypothetical protein